MLQFNKLGIDIKKLGKEQFNPNKIEIQKKQK